MCFLSVPRNGLQALVGFIALFFCYSMGGDRCSRLSSVTGMGGTSGRKDREERKKEKGEARRGEGERRSCL